MKYFSFSLLKHLYVIIYLRLRLNKSIVGKRTALCGAQFLESWILLEYLLSAIYERIYTHSIYLKLYMPRNCLYLNAFKKNKDFTHLNIHFIDQNRYL